MSKAHAAALRRRWDDPAYRVRQTEANRRTDERRKEHFADPLARRAHAVAVRVGWRIRKEGRR